MSTSATLIITNQTTNPAFDSWLRHLAAACGPLIFCCGNAPADIGPGMTVQPAPAYDRSSPLSRLLTWSRFTLVVSRHLLRQGGQTPLLAVSNPPFMPLAAWLLWRRQRRRYALLEWDIYPHILAPMGLASPRHPLYRLWQAAHRRALQEASLVITIGEQMAQTLRCLAGDTSLPLQVIPNWVDTEWLRPLPRAQNPFAQELQLDHKLVVLYSGNLGATHAIETILAVASAVQDDPRIHFLIIGEGSKRPLVAEAIAAGRLSNARLLPRQPVARLPLALATADVGIVTLAAGYEALSVPSKTYSSLAVGSVLLGISRPPNDLAHTIQRHQCGANFAPDEIPAIAAWLRALANDRNGLQALQHRARQAAETCYSRPKGEATMTAAVKSWLS